MYETISDFDNGFDLLKERSIDVNDLLVGLVSGTIGGLIDIFLVKSPYDSKLTKFTDSQVETLVKKFAKLAGWDPKFGKEDNIKSAIAFLERNFAVNYDQRHSGDVNNKFKMSTNNHHMKSSGHWPDTFGLFFLILNQFTSTSTFLSEGKLYTIATDKFELRGNCVVSKIYYGVINWLFHILSDISGSSGSKGRGSGIAIPFYEFFSMCNFGKFNVEKDKQDLATIATRAFQEGYDIRHGVSMSIPVIVTNLLIRVVWAIRERFQYDNSMKYCIENSQNNRFRLMLMIGIVTLCAFDGIYAFIKSKGNFLKGFIHMNLVAWICLIKLVLKEIFLTYSIDS